MASLKWRLNAIVLSALALGLGHKAWAGTITYQYDSLGRIVIVSHDNGDVTNYQLDAAGNRQSVSLSVPKPVLASFTQRIAPGSTNNMLNLQFVGGNPPTSVAYQPNPLPVADGVISISGVALLYTPPATTGAYTLQYTASNAAGTSDPATATLNIDPTAHIWGQFQWGAPTNW